MKNMNVEQEKNISQLEEQINKLERVNLRLKRENTELRECISEYKEFNARARQLEVDFVSGIQYANEVIASCKEMIQEGWKMKSKFQNQANRLFHAAKY